MSEKRTHILLGAAALSCGALFVAFFVYRALFDPSIVFLVDDGDAEWIRFKRQTYLRVLPLDNQVREFEHSFTSGPVPAEVHLEVAALGEARVYVNDREIRPDAAIPANWKVPTEYRLENHLRPGRNSIRIDVVNAGEPPACRARATAIDLATGPHWRVRVPGQAWTPAAHVDELPPSELSRAFERSDRALLGILPFLLVIGAAGAALYGFGTSKRCTNVFRGHTFWSPVAFRWILLIAWTGMAVNNAIKIPIHLGFDVLSHLDYVFYIARLRALPSPSEGWQMFQAPLFYVLAAVPAGLLDNVISAEHIVKLLRALTLACGVAQIEIAYRMLRSIYPQRADLQIIGTTVAALLPINLYMSQFTGNDPLTGVWVGGSAALVIAGSKNPSVLNPIRHWILIGGLLGLGLLTKAHAMVAVPPILLWLTYLRVREARQARASVLGALARPVVVALVIVAIAGPYYGWIWSRHGTPFSLGADYMQWWQDPGYRTISQYTSFGKALTYGVASADKSFWDTLYSSFALDTFLSGEPEYDRRPPWNDRFMLAGAWLGLIPLALMLLGALRTVVAPGDSSRAGWFVLAIAGAYLAALVHVNLNLPAYSASKTSYTLGLIPAYTFCLTAGIEVLSRWKPLAVIATGMVAAWGAAAGIAYFVW